MSRHTLVVESADPLLISPRDDGWVLRRPAGRMFTLSDDEVERFIAHVTGKPRILRYPATPQ